MEESVSLCVYIYTLTYIHIHIYIHIVKRVKETYSPIQESHSHNLENDC